MAAAFCRLTARSPACSGARLSTTSRVACGGNVVWERVRTENRQMPVPTGPLPHRPSDCHRFTTDPGQAGGHNPKSSQSLSHPHKGPLQ